MVEWQKNHVITVISKPKNYHSHSMMSLKKKSTIDEAITEAKMIKASVPLRNNIQSFLSFQKANKTNEMNYEYSPFSPLVLSRFFLLLLRHLTILINKIAFYTLIKESNSMLMLLLFGVCMCMCMWLCVRQSYREATTFFFFFLFLLQTALCYCL